MNSRVASFGQLSTTLFLLVIVFAPFAIAVNTQQHASLETHRPVDETENQNVLDLPVPPSLTRSSSAAPSPTNAPNYTPAETNILGDLHIALSTMQDHYFAIWLGKWTTAIDWTAAVIGTYVSATLSTLSHSIDYTVPGSFDKSRKLDVEAQMVENEINKYFAQSISYYFGEDHFAIRMQAFDDMLWVVLGWLESTQFIEAHTGRHYSAAVVGAGDQWHARQFVPAFAHRARVFYELAEKGWDWRLCGGGMTWNPRLLPYKNAITNQLFISASVSMYLHSPGDENCSPFLSQYDTSNLKTSENGSFLSQQDKPGLDVNELYNECDETARGRYDVVYLANAVNGYEWLKNSGMTNEQGLYVDGFHIRGYRQNHSKTTCDERNEMVYTYNQGVILSGLRGLWEATGNTTYLEDGHELVRNVIRATGWTDTNIKSKAQKHDKDSTEDASSSEWNGLGSNGILTELCDPSGRCSQNGQTFKGIFFHHLTTFCTPLPALPARPGKTHAASREVAMLHQASCNEYVAWVIHNAQAALATRDEQGRFGGWWGAPHSSSSSSSSSSNSPDKTKSHKKRTHTNPRLPKGAVDYRNFPTLYYDLDIDPDIQAQDEDKQAFYNRHYANIQSVADANDRGRGRTVETQGSGVAVVRAMWEFLRRWGGASR